MFNCECFTIDVSIQNEMPFVDRDKTSVFHFAKSRWWNLFYPSIMKADPFLFVHNDILYLFYEEMSIGNGLGVIKMISTKDLHQWSKPVLITHEPQCHFSYPWVFEDDGDVYMMPETGCDHNIRLYKATDGTLTHFEYFKVILKRDRKEWGDIKYDYADSCLYKKDGLYYLFSSYYLKKGQYYLELYVSDKIDGEYKLHPASPICIGNKYGRCAGSLIEVNGKLYRPTQDCEVVYGGQVNLMEIDELTPTTYREHVVKNSILPTELPFYKDGGHQVNFAVFKGRIVVATDSRYLCRFTLERIRIKMLKLLHLKANKPY